MDSANKVVPAEHCERHAGLSALPYVWYYHAGYARGTYPAIGRSCAAADDSRYDRRAGLTGPFWCDCKRALGQCMKRITVTPREDWQARVESVGLAFLTGGTPYRNESACYELTLEQSDLIEVVTNELHELCLQAVQHVIDRNRFGEGHPRGGRSLIRDSCAKVPTSGFAVARWSFGRVLRGLRRRGLHLPADRTATLF